MAKDFRRPKLGYVWYLSESVAMFTLAFVMCFLYFRPAEWISQTSLLGEVVVPLGATFIGAMLAFHLERVRQKSLQDQANKAEAGLAFFKLSRMVNRLRNWQTVVVDEHRESPARILSIPALTPQSVSAEIDFDKLSFLFPRDADLLGELAIAQDRFISLADLINERSRFLRDVVQTKLKDASVPESVEMTRAKLSEIVGEGNLVELKNLTDQMIKCIDEDVDRMHELTNRLGSTLTKYFPKMHLKLELLANGSRE